MNEKTLILNVTPCLTLHHKGGSGVYLQQDFRDDGVDVEQGVQIKTQELFTSPDKQTCQVVRE